MYSCETGFETMQGTNVTVIFQHIPKAAGSTILSILRRKYSPSERCHLTGPGGIREAEFARMPLEQRAQFRLIMGHLFFGIHRHVPGPTTYLTLLRHPVDRVVSHYQYVKRTPHHYLYDRVVAENMSLEAYVSSGVSLELNNGQVRSLYGPEHQATEYGRCSREMLIQAQRNLRECYSVVGITERFDESLLLMRQKLEWTNLPLYDAKNVSRKKGGETAVSKQVISIIERDNVLDLELYEDVSKSFAADVEQAEISRELRHFRLLNGMYARYFRARHSARRIARTSLSALERT